MSRARGSVGGRKRATSSASRPRRSTPRPSREIEALQAVAAAIGRRGDLVRVAEETLDVVRSLTGMPIGALYRFDRAQDALVIAAQRGLTPDQLELVRVRPVRDSRLGAALLAGEFSVMSLEDDPPQDPRLRAMAEQAGHRSQLTLTIAGKDGPWGVIALVSTERRTFDADEIRLLQAVAQQVGLAVENAGLFDEAGRRAAEYRALFEVGGLVSQSLEVAHILDVIVERSRALLEVAATGIFRFDAASGVCVYERGIGLSPAFIRALRVGPGEGTTGKAVAQREPVWSADILVDPALSIGAATRALVEQERYRAALSVPILIKGEAYGALAVYWWDRHEPERSEIELLAALAGQAAIALDNARLYQAAANRGRRLATLARLTETLTSTLSLEEVLGRVAQSAVDLFGSSLARLWLLDAEGTTLALRAQAGAQASVEDRTRLALGEGITGQIVLTRAPVVVDDLRADPRGTNPARVRAEGLVSFAGVPLFLGDRVLGAVSVAVRERRPFSDEDLSLLQSLSNQAAIAIENARLFQEARGQAARLRAIAELGRVLVSTFEVDRVLELVGTHARETLGLANIGICLYDESAGVLRFVAGAGFPAEFVEKYGLAPGEGVAGRAFLEGRPVWTTNFFDDQSVALRPESRQQVATHPNRAVLAIPLIRERPFGCLVAHREVGHRFTGEEIEYLSTFASQVAVAIENARLYAETTRRLAETRALLEVAEILNSTLEPRPLLRQVAMKIAQVCGVDRCTIEGWDGDHVIPLMAQFVDGRRDERQWRAFSAVPSYVPADVPAHARALATRQPVLINDTASTDLIPRDWIETYSIRSYMVVPLIRQDQAIGFMNLDYCERPTAFAPWQVNLAMAIAGQLALSLENSRLYGEAERRLKETSTLFAVGQALSRPGPAEEVMRGVAREVALAFGADMVGVHQVTPDKDVLRALTGYHVPKHLLEIFATRPFVLGRMPALAEAWRSGCAVWSSDVGNDPGFDPEIFGRIDPHSVLLAPTPVRGEPVGAIFLVWWGTGRQPSADEVRLVEAVAAQVGLAMENAELARQTQAKLQETETLLAVSRTLASTLDLDSMPRHFLRHMVQSLGADTAGLWLLDETGQWMVPLAGYHVPPAVLEKLRGVRLSIKDHGLYAEAARTRRCVVSTDVSNDPRFPLAMRTIAPQRTQVFVPIVAKDRVVGGLAATWWERERVLSESERQLIEAVANQAGVALENARLFRDHQERAEELSVLHELSRAVTGRLDQAELIDTIHHQVARLLDVRHMVMVLHDEERDELEVALRIEDGVRADHLPRRYPPRHGLMFVVLQTGRPIRTDDYAAECRRHGVSAVQRGGEFPRWLGVPMVAGDRTLGVLALRSRDRAFTERDERLLANIAHLAALALRSARLFEERSRAYTELAAAQDQLVRTEKLRALGEMASGVAHDFNNLLASIVGRAQLLLREVEDPRHRRWIEVVERSALDGAQTVRRLQEFTRIRRDQPFVVVDLNRVVQEALEVTDSRWRDEPRGRGIVVDVKTLLTAALPPVSGDPAELREALTNLILNALDAMPAGGRLTLSTAVADGSVELAVSDTGVGIPEHVKPKIFDPFFTTKGPQGTGLGLSMTYGIISRHGARVAVESEAGRGTTFRLTFPVSTAPPTSRPEPAPLPVTRHLRCLVVDDEAVVGDVLGDMLLSAGHRVVVVREGRSAVARFGGEPFDVVFTDLSMPGLSGWDVARAIKELDPEVPVFLVTGFGVELPADELQDQGVDAVLAKPLRITDILGALAGVRPRI
jgi:GAF domain-containing protein